MCDECKAITAAMNQAIHEVRHPSPTRPKSVLCAVVVNDRGSILPGSCRFTKQQTEEWAVQHCAWEQMRQLGARVMQARLTIEEDMDVTLMSTPQKKRYIVHTMTG